MSVQTTLGKRRRWQCPVVLFMWRLELPIAEYRGTRCRINIKVLLIRWL